MCIRDSFRPVHHGSENKGQVVVSKVEGAAICNLQLLSFQVETEEILDHSAAFKSQRDERHDDERVVYDGRQDGGRCV